LSGALLVDKPAGVTSHDVVARVRRERDKGTKVGHAGTLDPFATGLLIVLLGRATRLQRYLLDLPKTYVATARLGWRSTTGDPDGELTETGVVPAQLELPTGEVEQTLPMTSAVKVDGERLYKKAHRGETVETPTRIATIHRAELLESEGRERATFEVECASGTYVRTLVETLDDAYCEALRRTAIGPHRLSDGEDVSISAAELMSFLPECPLDADETKRVSHGRPVEGRRGPAQDASALSSFPRPETGPAAASPPVRLTHEGALIAIARQDGDNLRPEVVLV
jgi:tRNA pseudouridine55 synthase